MRGTKESASLNNILVILKVTVVFIGLGWGFINNANHTPFIPVNEGEALLALEDVFS
jgi:APA family basic amino acid/polyamine antiporter